ncbi:MAG: RnfABCDGE type electron transport complex subunit D, partial [Candidatus Omnitrophica bacterium]|nr:RnfABCDGE type electron transport complex subunit D [Candidatus Omnitrophota bacterium]
SAIIDVAAAVCLETAILYLKTKAFKITESSVITVLIVGYVLSPDSGWLKFVAASVIAIASKSLIRFKKKHIFNPAAIGIFLAAILFGADTQWKGTYVWYVVVPFGFYFAYRIKKLEIVLGYAIAFFALFGAQAIFNRVQIWHVFGYLSYFYVFVMVIEPLTTPAKPLGKFLFGLFVASLIFILTEAGVKFDAELLSLLVLNMAVPALNEIARKKGERL